MPNFESGYYPSGAEFDPSAPWNEPVIPEQDFDVEISQTLTKKVTVTTDDYAPEFDDKYNEIIPDTTDTDWIAVYEECEHYTPLQLIQLFKRYLEAELNHTEDVAKHPAMLEALIEECDNWTEEDISIG